MIKPNLLCEFPCWRTGFLDRHHSLGLFSAAAGCLQCVLCPLNKLLLNNVQGSLSFQKAPKALYVKKGYLVGISPESEVGV